MSRLIVKNLPNNVTAEKLKEHFSQKGLVTDVQLKYTKDGKFRHFGFVGYQNEEEAKTALDYFNNTFIRSVKIEVQLCAGLGDSSKPKSWSKYAPDSSAFKKLHPKDEPEKEKDKNKKEKKKDKLKNITEEIIVEKMKKHKDDPLFMEYLEAHGKDAISILEKVKKVDEDSGVEDGNDEESGNNESKETSAANADISDLEYLKLKMKPVSSQEEENKLVDIKKTEESKDKVKFFTVKVSDLPYNVTKSQLKELFRQMHPSSIRLPRGKKGFSYICFKTEKHMKQALSKNKSFIGGKQISVKEYKDKGCDQEKSDASERWRQQEEILKQEENIAESGCIFVRNLSYTVTEEELQELFSKFGPVTEVNVPVDRLTRRVKGFATLTFLMPEHAVQAYSQLDGTVFHGRMLHLLPGKTKDVSQSYESNEDGNETYKRKKTKQMKENSGLSYNWNSLFLGQNAIADIIAQNYNASKEQVLMGNDAAVRMALGETQIVSETRQFLEDNGVKLDAFNQAPKKRSKTVILIKNLPANTNVAEIRELFVKFGELGRVVLPPSGVTGIVEFLEPSEARSAFVKLAYTKFKHLPLYLEWAPDDTFCSEYDRSEKNKEDDENKSENQTDVAERKSSKLKAEKGDEEEEFFEDPEPDTTLFVKNLNFSTDEKSLKEHFSKCGKIASVTIAKKKDPSRPGALLSMGYGFVQFYKKNSLSNALKNLQLSDLDNHKLELKRSNRTVSTNVVDEKKKNNVEKQTGSKILVRNIPFQATQKEVSQLFKTFGEIKALRLPKKMVGTGSHRGFCFVEYNSKSDAKRAMKALCQSTHLYGRRLVLEWAQAEESIDELRKRTAKNFLSSAEPTQTKRGKATASIDIEAHDDSDVE